MWGRGLGGGDGARAQHPEVGGGGGGGGEYAVDYGRWVVGGGWPAAFPAVLGARSREAGLGVGSGRTTRPASVSPSRGGECKSSDRSGETKPTSAEGAFLPFLEGVSSVPAWVGRGPRRQGRCPSVGQTGRPGAARSPRGEGGWATRLTAPEP